MALREFKCAYCGKRVRVTRHADRRQRYCSLKCEKRQYKKKQRALDKCREPSCITSHYFACTLQQLKQLQTTGTAATESELTFETVRDEGFYPGFTLAKETGDLARYRQIIEQRQRNAGETLHPMTGRTRAAIWYTLDELAAAMNCSRIVLVNYTKTGIIANGEGLKIKLKSRVVNGVTTVRISDVKTFVLAILKESKRTGYILRRQSGIRRLFEIFER